MIKRLQMIKMRSRYWIMIVILEGRINVWERKKSRMMMPYHQSNQVKKGRFASFFQQKGRINWNTFVGNYCAKRKEHLPDCLRNINWKRIVILKCIRTRMMTSCRTRFLLTQIGMTRHFQTWHLVIRMNKIVAQLTSKNSVFRPRFLSKRFWNDCAIA